jgi:hypothetical protein
VDKATRQGFTLVYSRDITPHVLPTIETLHAIRLQHLEPALALVQRYLRVEMPLKWKVLRWLFRKQLRTLSRLQVRYTERTDPALFVRHVEYLILLFQLPPVAMA